MRVLIQRSKYSNVLINNKVYGEINSGIVLFTGFSSGDCDIIIDKMINKIINLRIFKDEKGLTNLNLNDVNGSILSISQFTLYADATNGRRPSFTDAMEPKEASRLYDMFNNKLKLLGINVQTGIFGETMEVNIKNDGPFTIFLDSKELFK